MSWLDSAKSLIKSAYNYLAGDDDKKVDNTPKNNSAQKAPNSTFRPNGGTVGEVGDKVEITGSNAQTATKAASKSVAQKQTTPTQTAPKQTTKNLISNGAKVTQKDIDEIIKSIKDKCDKLGMTTEEAKKYIDAKLGLSLKGIQNKTLEQQYKMLCCHEAALNLALIDRNKNKFPKDINMDEFITMVSENYFDAVINGGVQDIKEFQKFINNEINNAFVQFKKAETDEEKAAVLNNVRLNIKTRVESEYKAKKKGQSKAEIARLEKEEKSRTRSLEKGAQLAFNITVEEPESRRFGVFIRSGEDYGDAYVCAMSCTDNKTRSRIAGKCTHNFVTFGADLKHQFGDDVTVTAYGCAVGTVVQNMTGADAAKFETDAFNYRKKVESGEIKAPWMTKEHFTEESIAIGVGITNNKNMSSAEKAALLNTWDKHALEFSDYCEVKEALNKALAKKASENPNTAQGIKNVKRILNENYYNNIEQLPRSWEKRKQENAEAKVENKVETKVEAKPKATEATLKSELKTKTITEVKRSYSNTTHELARIVLKNDVEYKNRIDDILDYLKGYSGKEIGLMAVGCSTPTISKIIQAFPEKANDILDIVAPSMCFAGRHAVERIAEKGNNNAAA